ncbi:ABC transporter ATP-binding protein [Lichenibacterium dinghuense]|uniref:ABC transporter ATP-binding protein n=1 Tax=Lichenibacterium dinghuense TaxID=2895977 RepID=UPI001F3991DD|nr:ABC transporter ATP-binding protein [Lichenibacterium sp. 6Y81]
MTVLAAEGLAVGHGAARVASGIDLALEPGTVTCLLGPNGVGKTTLFRTLLGLLPPQAGRVLLGGDDLAGLSRAGIARRLAYVPQAHAGAFPYTVLDLAVMGRTAALGAFAVPGRADIGIARDALDAMGIAHLGDRDATRISGGQLQLALIARALAQRAGAIVMDEPTASLDLGNRIRVLGVVRRLADDGLAVLVSTHEPEQAFAVADRAAVIEAGGRFEAGPVERLLTAERLSRLYGVPLAVEATPSGRRVVGSAAPIRPGGGARTFAAGATLPER